MYHIPYAPKLLLKNVHRNENIVISTKLPSLAVVEVVILTNGDNNFTKMSLVIPRLNTLKVQIMVQIIRSQAII